MQLGAPILPASIVLANLLAFAVQGTHGFVRCQLVCKLQPAVATTTVCCYTESCNLHSMHMTLTSGIGHGSVQ